MKILIVGSGGREHAIAWKLLSCGSKRKVFVCPGNGGTQSENNCENVECSNMEEMLAFARNKNVDLTVIGPEVPLSEGIVNLFEKNGLRVFGPVSEGAKLESSKCYSKEFMKKHGIETANFFVSDNLSEAKGIVDKMLLPFVIKFDGLAAGKGVKIILSVEEGKNYLEDIFDKNVFKVENPKVVIEECLIGNELSYLVFTDGESFVPMVPARDYKRVFDNDKGPNTGGMGCYSTPVFFTPALEEKIKQDIVVRTLNGLAKDGIPYKGVLYFGLMLTAKGLSLLEYNVRFGDPETQVILPRLENDPVEIFDAIIKGDLKRVKVRWKDEFAVCVVLASCGYPGKYDTGKIINGLDRTEDVLVFHAGTERRDRKILTCGGRVLGVVGIDRVLAEAKRKAYCGAQTIDFEGKHYRKDIP